jgi:ATP-dependent DNA helicase RecQ
VTRHLTAAGYLQLDVKRHGGLSMTEKGRNLVRGEESFRYREDTGPVGPKKAARPAPAAADLSGSETALFNALKELRLELAKERRVPAYAIFPDRALADMARRQPRSEAEFAEIHGIGEAKLKKFAVPFLDAIAAFQEDPA